MKAINIGRKAVVRVHNSRNLRGGRHICRPYIKHEMHDISLEISCRDAIYRIQFPRFRSTTLFGGGIKALRPTRWNYGVMVFGNRSIAARTVRALCASSAFSSSEMVRGRLPMMPSPLMTWGRAIVTSSTPTIS